MPFKFDHSKQYYRTDLKENALDYLDKLKLFYDRTAEDESYWKWTIIALHGTLYHLMLTTLRNTDGSGVYKNEIRDESGYIDFSQEDKMEVVSFIEAFKRIKIANRMGGYVNSRAYETNPLVDETLKELNKWRNNFIHYKPIAWSIHIEIFNRILRRSLPVLYFLLNQSGRIRWSDDDELDIANSIFESINSSCAIQAKETLVETVKFVGSSTSELCQKIIGKSLPIHSLTIFSHSQEEFEELKAVLATMGSPYNENNGPRVTLHEPIVVGKNTITHLRIRHPDLERPEVGCNDFDVEDYEAFKAEYLAKHPENLILIQRPDYEMIEFRHPDFDILAYVVSK